MDTVDTSTRVGNGGSAFPRPCSEDRTQGDQHDGNRTIDEQDGMTLRDYFATKAMVGELSCQDVSVSEEYATDEGMAGLADWAYAMADAMLVARKGGK